MKGKKTFTNIEKNSILKLLSEKVKSPKNKQKSIRNKIRKIRFYITDFDKTYKGFTPEDFKNLIKNNVVEIK